MTKSEVGEDFPYKAVIDLAADEVNRRSDAVIAHMEEAQPEASLVFLYEQGLLHALAEHMPASPFRQVSPRRAYRKS